MVNPAWQGTPLRPWRGERYSISNGTATISAQGGNASLWQPFEKAKAGKVYRFTAEVYETSEIIPWIRTFICRIVQLNFSNRTDENKFKQDLDEMYRMYGIGEEADK